MKKFYLSFFACLFLFPAVHAQIRMAILGGGHQSTVQEKNDLPNWNSIKKNYSARTGAHFGVLADIPIGGNQKFTFQPGIIFNNKGRKYEEYIDSAGDDYSMKSAQYINYIDMPLNFVLKFPISKKAKFIIGGGPYLTAFYNGKEKTETYVQGVYSMEENEDLPVGKAPGKYTTWGAGVNALAGFEIGRIFLTANFSRSFNDFYQSSDYEGTFKHQLLGGTLGIFIGKQFDQKIQIKDTDKDGIADENDFCPDEPGLLNGCPDKDGDGIADRYDKCPDIPGIAKYDGCPIPDSDKDGLNDEEDNCPDTPGLKKYNGCPAPDTDNDGINDEEDSCPNVAGVARYNGCPVPDADKDGVNDEEDKCPDEPGSKSNNGCPDIKKEIIEKVDKAAGSIQFLVGKAELLPASFKVLDDLVVILNENPELIVSIEGHTSREGSFDYNMTLSEKRALVVKNYLQVKGIHSDRLSAKGFGPTQPLNEGKNNEEKAKNRRVEMKLSNR